MFGSIRFFIGWWWAGGFLLLAPPGLDIEHISTSLPLIIGSQQIQKFDKGQCDVCEGVSGIDSSWYPFTLSTARRRIARGTRKKCGISIFTNLFFLWSGFLHGAFPRKISRGWNSRVSRIVWFGNELVWNEFLETFGSWGLFVKKLNRLTWAINFWMYEENFSFFA